uniref:Catalase n=1 Tax=Rhabditophanes sp. KR3021 TaxID=114890 RepID=A0AC35TYH4_9BILA
MTRHGRLPMNPQEAVQTEGEIPIEEPLQAPQLTGEQIRRLTSANMRNHSVHDHRPFSDFESHPEQSK